MKDVRVELKVCEMCGSLWLRAAGYGVYCRGCALWLSEFPIRRAHAPRVKVRRAVRSRSHKAKPAVVQQGSMADAGGAR